MVSTVVQVGTAIRPSLASAVGTLSQAQPAPLQPAARDEEGFVAQYSPQVYAVLVNGLIGQRGSSNILQPNFYDHVLETNLYNPNVAFPPLPGELPNLIPGAPPVEPLPTVTIDSGTQRVIAALRSLSGSERTILPSKMPRAV